MKWPPAYALSCSPDGRLLAAVGRDVVVVDVERRERVSNAHPLTHPASATFSGSGDALAVKSTSGRIVVLDPETGRILSDHQNTNEGEGSNILCAPGDRYLVDGSWAGTFTLRHILNGQIRSRDEFPGEMITRVTHDGHARFWAVEHKPKLRPGEDTPRPGYVSVVEWPFSSLRAARILKFGRHLEGATLSPDGARLCFLDQHRNELCVARTADGGILASAPLQLGGTGCDFAWSNDARVIGAVADKEFRFFRASDLASIGSYSAEHPSSILFHPNGREVVLGTWKSSSVEQVSTIGDSKPS